MSAPSSSLEVPDLVDLLLAEQQTLRAVDELSALHEVGGHDSGRFETLIPTGLPGVGQQFAFAVDLDACTGCKACVTACHSLNGLEADETWRRVGLVEGGNGSVGAPARAQTITTACHHCEEPACLAGCPVRAYEKDPTTGIVIHLDDQCIGCRYCQLMCPYDVPRFSERLGIVRKCDMCHGRLSVGEAPACVQGCPNEAISIEIAESGLAQAGLGARAAHGPDGDAVEETGRAAMLLPVRPGDMPESRFTRPTTRYRTTRVLPEDLRPLEGTELQPAEGHAPLAWMLVGTQAAVGVLLWDQMLGSATGSRGLEELGGLMSWGDSQAAGLGPILLATASILTFGGLAGSVLHLGRPQWGFRAFLGLRTSWLSREIVVLGAFAGALAVATVAAFAPFVSRSPLSLLAPGLEALAAPSRLAALALGLLGVFCSVQVYAATGRPLWRRDRTLLRFGGSTLLLGTAVTVFGTSAVALGERETGVPDSGISISMMLLVVLAAATLTKLALEDGRLIRGEPGADDAALARTRLLFAGTLRRVVATRRGLAISFGVAAPLLQIAGLALGFGAAGSVVLAGACLVGCLVAEGLERSVFFRGEAMRAMPGGRRA